MFSTKNIWFCLGITIGVLAGVLVFVAGILPGGTPTWLKIGVWPAFVAWALYFAKGGGKDGLIKTMAGNTAGMIAGFLSLLLLSAFTLNNTYVAALVLAIIIVVAAFIMTMCGNFDFVSYVPALFCGCAAVFGWGGGTAIQPTIALLLTMWIGAILAHLSNLWGTAMNKA